MELCGLGWSDIELSFDFSKMGTILPIKYICESDLKKSANLQIPSFYLKEQKPKRKCEKERKKFRFLKWTNLFLTWSKEKKISFFSFLAFK